MTSNAIKLKDIIDDGILAYKRNYLLAFLGIQNTIFAHYIRIIYNMIMQLVRHKEGSVQSEFNFSINNNNVQIIIENEYLSWSQGFIYYINERYTLGTKTEKSLKLYIGSNFFPKNSVFYDVVLDLSDLSLIQKNLYRHTNVYIKRELYEINKKQYSNTRSLPYLFSNTFYETQKILDRYGNNDNSKNYYLVFGGNRGNGRETIIEDLQRKLGEKFYIYEASPRDHIHILQNSMYSLNLFGVGQYCHRWTEIALSDTLMVCQKYNIVYENDFTDMKNIVYFSSVDELIEKIIYLDNNPELYNSIKRGFKEHYYQYHTHEYYCKKLLNYIINNEKYSD